MKVFFLESFPLACYTVQLTAVKLPAVQPAGECRCRPHPSEFQGDSWAIHNQTSVNEVYAADAGSLRDIHLPNYFLFLWTWSCSHTQVVEIRRNVLKHSGAPRRACVEGTFHNGHKISRTSLTQTKIAKWEARNGAPQGVKVEGSQTKAPTPPERNPDNGVCVHENIESAYIALLQLVPSGRLQKLVCWCELAQ